MADRFPGPHIELNLDGIVFNCVTRTDIDVWALPSEIIIRHDDVLVVKVAGADERTRMDVEGSQVLITDDLSWNDDHVTVTAERWRPIAATTEPEPIVVYVPDVG